MKLQISLFKRRGYTTRSQTTAFCSYEKSYAFLEDMSARSLNAIITDFKRLQYCITAERKHMDEHRDEVSRP